MDTSTQQDIEDLITPERYAKGDLSTTSVRIGAGRERINTAEQTDGTILAKLVESGVLEDHQASYGLGFLEMQHAFLARVRHKSTSIFFLALGGGGVPGEDAADMYLQVCKAINNKRVEVIQFACTASKSVVGKYHNSIYKEYFEKLVTEMDRIREDYLEKKRIELK